MMLKKFRLLFLCCCPLWTLAQRTPMTDGPYVAYDHGKIMIRSVERKDSGYVARTDSIAPSQKGKLRLTVRLEGHPEWDFTVPLKPQLQVPPSLTRGNAAKTLILSDIEGEFEPFHNLLLAAGVMDTKYNWTFGRGRLVIAGDLFDRGKQVTQFLWLLYKLEDEANDKGGQVHVILGNHDIMNLDGDYRYVDPAYKTNAVVMNHSFRTFYNKDSELGRWLRSRNTIEKIGDLLVMHGGMSPEILHLKQPVEAINNQCRPYYDVDLGKIPPALQVFFGEDALFWYRGYFAEPKASEELIDSTMSYYQAKKIIVGHDIIDHVASFYHGKVIGVDVDQHADTHEALLIENGKYYRIDDKNKKQLLELN